MKIQMKVFKFLILFLIFKLSHVFSTPIPDPLDFIYVCLYDTECDLRLKLNYKPKNAYINFSDNCFKNEKTEKFDLIFDDVTDVPPDPPKLKLNYYKALFKRDNWHLPKGRICLDNRPKKSNSYEDKHIYFIRLSTFYSIDDNNDLGIILGNYDQKRVKLVVSKKYEYRNPTETLNFTLCNNKLVSYVSLNSFIEQSDPFSVVYIFLFFENDTNLPTLLYRITVFNHSNISSFEHKVLDKHILAEIKLKNPKPFNEGDHMWKLSSDKFFLSAQSAEDIDGLPSRCGDKNLQWKIEHIFHKITPEGIIFLLPLDLYGKKVRICASFKGDKSPEHKIPLYTFEVNDKTSGYFKNVFYSNPMGIAEITLNSDFHPLSEIMLVHACDLEDNSAVSRVADSKVPRSVFDIQNCSNDDHKIGHNTVLTKYNFNLSYNTDDLYRSLYYKNVLFDDFIPNKLVYLPDKSIKSASGTKWIKYSMFLPRLYVDNRYPYVILACDRWKHTFCFTEDQFDSVMGIVYPSKRSFLEIKAKWEDGDMIAEIKTSSSEQFLVKLIMSRNSQYTDYQTICNDRKGVYPHSYSHRVKDSWKYYTNTFKGLTPGKIYYVCLINPKSHKELSQKITEMHSKQTTLPDKIIEFDVKYEVSWDFIGIINTQTPLSGTHFIINRQNDAIKILVPTTGFPGVTYSVRFFFSNDFSFNCKMLKPTELTNISTSANQYSSFITFVTENYTYKEQISESRDQGGFWLPNDGRRWISFGNYISYFGEFTPKDRIYKVCSCVQKGCYFAGIASESKMQSLELNQIIKSNDFYGRFIYGVRICFYNKRKLSCFTQTDNLETSFKSVVKINVPLVQINHISFDEENKLMCLLSPNSVYVYEDGPEPRIIISGIHNMEMMFSFSDATFFLSSEHVYVSTGESRIGHLISAEIAGPKVEETKTIKFNKELQELGSIQIPPHHDIKNVYIYKVSDKIYSCFLITEDLSLDYYKIELDFESKKTHLAKKVDAIDVKDFFPGVTHGVRLNVSTRTVANQDRFIIFLSHQESDEIKVFYLDDHKIKYYSIVTSIPGTIDFITTKTHIMSLNTISFENQFLQYVIQIEYDNLLEVSVKYPELTDLRFNIEYSLQPEISNGIPLRFYISKYTEDDNVAEEEIPNTGLKLNRSTGEISGTCRFRGYYEVVIHVDFLLGKTSVPLKLISRCPLGYEYSPAFRECSECQIGFYRHILTLDTCLRCEDYMPNTTTKGVASSSPLDCLCKPGFYSNTKTCIKCPEGKYNDELGAISCDKTCLPNQISSVVGASSREELKCICIPGYFDKNGQCEECQQGTYCPGKNVVYNCPENTSTLGPRSTSISECLCNPGYELTEDGCKPCNIYSYKSAISNEKCTLCSSDTPEGVYAYTKSPGSTSKYQCRNCMPGFYFNGTSCVQCPDKSFCKGFNFDPISCGANSIVTKSILHN
ncbi:hypothetical protein TpMuguga_01g00438 [Theileria parva strain Muguga]|uniref:Tyrosine-protein kinase ephrin type A/B receptor-like domain-containing protein n=1 Tax=Theileria parva TaxID=5875 RepID=Q4N8M6_THEPA|nr:uncharacterized protein TpMuguga_01g00438 [Theileria parva strain Muguga]EAN33682.1 hypothetical protein TpMuguga_01g00438 [Theileria parva strain Muguga]|eukprot:XP_765965.1 hypothetical protein [Theileria parva strain Muguga]